MDIKYLSALNKKRCEQDFKEPLNNTGWDPIRWALTIAEETGEVAEAVLGAFGGKKAKAHLGVKHIGEEIADVVIYCDLLATRLGLSLEDIVIKKFNKKSRKIGSKIKLDSRGVSPDTKR